MGLDMYLSAKKYVRRVDMSNANDITYPMTPDQENPEFNAIVNSVDARGILTDEPFTGITIDIPVGYWRKANWLHDWFVNNVQQGNDDCGDYYVSFEKLNELKEVIHTVLDNPKTAKVMLPAVDGFFFGATEIYQEDGSLNDYYKETLEYTLKVINRLVKDPDLSVFYTSSW